MLLLTSRQLLGFLSSLLCILSFSVVVLTEVKIKNFVVTGQLPDGENKFMRFGDIVVREASISETSLDRKFQLTLMLRQVAAGQNFLQLIYKITSKNDEKKTRLVECEVIDDWKSANEFRNKFERQLDRAGITTLSLPNLHQNSHDSTGETEDDDVDDDDMMKDLSSTALDNWDLEFDPEAIEPLHKETIDLTQGLVDLQNVTVRVLRDDEMVGELKLAFDVRLQQKHCRRLHRRLRRGIQRQQQLERMSTDDTLTTLGKTSSNRSKRELSPLIDTFRFPGTKWCGIGSVASQSSSIGAHVGTDVCCRQHDHCPVILPALSTQYGVFNYRMNTISHCTCDENRSKRELSMSQLSETFRFPGTKWCGVGYTALEARDLGGYSGTDKCCRGHDLGCPFFIEAFTEKYNLFNWRMYTIMHCSCDERFRSCLKQTNTGAADFVGKLFFNIVSTKCFVLKPEPVCSKRSWWGKCLKMEYKKQAHLRDPTPY